MIQVAMGGYKNSSTGVTVLDDAPIFYEPGFTIVSPLEIEMTENDQLYVLLRNRIDDAGQLFETPTIANLDVTIKDATTGDSIPGFLDTNESDSTVFNGNWDTDVSQFNPVVLIINSSIDVFSPVERVRTLDVFVRDTTNPDVNVFFRLISDDSNKFIHYININIDEIGNRFKFTSFGTEIKSDITSPSDSYILLSPFAYLQEVDTQEESDFSYPFESIFYKRQRTFNDEEFGFFITSASHEFISEGVSLMNVPNYTKAAVLFIDKYVHTEMLDIQARTYLDILVVGRLSGIEHTFRVNLVR
tara:strand:- start:1593 stop:2498 length:906 start_codon:yes stop_codon:yes gene_type:complete